MLLIHCILTLMYDLFKRENLVFKQQAYWYFCIVRWGKTGRAQSFPPPKSSYLSIYLFSLLDYATLWMYLNNFKWPIPKWELCFQSYKFIGTSSLWGGERLGRPILSPPPPPSIILGSFNLLFSLSVYVTLWLYLNNFEWPIPKRDQVFKPTRLLVLLHCGVGKNWAGPFFPPSKMLGSFYLSSRFLDYVILLLYLNSLDLYQAENQVFKLTSLFVIVGWGKTGPAHSFPPP